MKQRGDVHVRPDRRHEEREQLRQNGRKLPAHSVQILPVHPADGSEAAGPMIAHGHCERLGILSRAPEVRFALEVVALHRFPWLRRLARFHKKLVAVVEENDGDGRRPEAWPDLVSHSALQPKGFGKLRLFGGFEAGAVKRAAAPHRHRPVSQCQQNQPRAQGVEDTAHPLPEFHLLIVTATVAFVPPDQRVNLWIMNDVVERMRRDWDARAAEDAKYYVACQNCNQSDSEFYSGAPEIVARVRRDYVFLPAHASQCRFLEIGCGLGRLMFSLAADCREIHGVDISPEMISIAREKLHNTSNVYLTVTENSDLGAYSDSYFDLAYSYAVFQHIPERAVIFRYLDETLRVLRPGGVFVGHFNGTAPSEARCDTWVGSWVADDELYRYARDRDWQILSREGANSLYLWLTMRKPAARAPLSGPVAARIVSVAHVSGGHDLVAGGPVGFATLYAAGIPDECCSLTGLSASIGSTPAPPCYLGPAAGDQPRQINIQVLEDTPIGEHDLVLQWNGRSISDAVRVNVTPRPPATPRVVAITDLRNVLVQRIIACGIMQVSLEECRDLDTLRIAIGNRPAGHSRRFCVEPLSRLYQVDVPVPAGISGIQTVSISVDGYQLPPVEVEIVAGER